MEECYFGHIHRDMYLKEMGRERTRRVPLCSLPSSHGLLQYIAFGPDGLLYVPGRKWNSTYTTHIYPHTYTRHAHHPLSRHMHYPNTKTHQSQVYSTGITPIIRTLQIAYSSHVRTPHTVDTQDMIRAHSTICL